MTTPRLPLDEAAREREWREQEAALREERDGEPGAMRGYRPLIRALRQSAPDMLPDDFAARMDSLAMAERGTLDAPGLRFQRRLAIAMAGFLVVALGGISALYGKLWLMPVLSLGQSTAAHAPWLPVLLAALALSAFFDFLRRAGFSRR